MEDGSYKLNTCLGQIIGTRKDGNNKSNYIYNVFWTHTHRHFMQSSEIKRLLYIIPRVLLHVQTLILLRPFAHAEHKGKYSSP